MLIFDKIKAFEDWRKQQSKRISFIPTMGCLHKGHLSLIENASQKDPNALKVCSIFVNPTQFDSVEDFEKYPRKPFKDIEVLKNKIDVLFIPNKSEIFPKGYKNFTEGLKLPNNIMKYMEGEKRPGHFKGVVNIVYKLISIIKPNSCFFGEKDYQQYLIIKTFFSINNMSVDIVMCSIIRENTGLALSSRNERLSKVDLSKCAKIYESLIYSKIEFLNQTDIRSIRVSVFKRLKANDIDLDYLEFRNNDTLERIEQTPNIYQNNIRVFIACIIKGVRLIDNLYIQNTH